MSVLNLHVVREHYVDTSIYRFVRSTLYHYVWYANRCTHLC
jgi:hypothetical protein